MPTVSESKYIKIVLPILLLASIIIIFEFGYKVGQKLFGWFN